MEEGVPPASPPPSPRRTASWNSLDVEARERSVIKLERKLRKSEQCFENRLAGALAPLLAKISTLEGELAAAREQARADAELVAAQATEAWAEGEAAGRRAGEGLRARLQGELDAARAQLRARDEQTEALLTEVVSTGAEVEREVGVERDEMERRFVEQEERHEQRAAELHWWRQMEALRGEVEALAGGAPKDAQQEDAAVSPAVQPEPEPEPEPEPDGGSVVSDFESVASAAAPSEVGTILSDFEEASTDGGDEGSLQRQLSPVLDVPDRLETTSSVELSVQLGIEEARALANQHRGSGDEDAREAPEPEPEPEPETVHEEHKEQEQKEQEQEDDDEKHEVEQEKEEEAEEQA